jgi:hypothetical protein
MPSFKNVVEIYVQRKLLGRPSVKMLELPVELLAERSDLADTGRRRIGIFTGPTFSTITERSMG